MQRRERAPERHRVADEPPPVQHERRHDECDNVQRAQLAREPDHDHHEQQQRQGPYRLLGEHRERNREPAGQCETPGEQIALQDHDSREHEQGAGEPGEVVVVDRSGQILCLRKQRDQRRGAGGERGPQREETARHRGDGEDRHHPEHHRDQPDQARIVPRELGNDGAQQVVQRGLLTLRFAGRWEAEMIGDAIDVMQVGQLVG